MEAVLRSSEPPPQPARYTFGLRLTAALLLVALADLLFFRQWPGATLGLFALALLVMVATTSPRALRSRPALAAGGLALCFALALVDDPSLLALLLFWLAAAMTVLLPRAARFGSGWTWAKRLAVHHLRIPIGAVRDLARWRRARRRAGPARFVRSLPVLVLPMLGSAVFLALFATANPLISDALGTVRVGGLFDGIGPVRIAFWALVLLPLWSLLRPRLGLRQIQAPSDFELVLPGVSLASVTLSLFAFNAIFALQNGLDIAFLWSGAPLPEGMTLAAYAHRGAYPLIATALLAGLFVLVTLQPGSETARSRLVRNLVYVWIAQNVLLVASTMLRTFDYIDAYSLTRLRIAALLWMGLVAVGLVLICVRIWRGKSGAWLINANLAAALILLSACSFVDLGRMAAAWNVRHAREAGGRGSGIDLCYLRWLGDPALLPLVELESRTRDAALRERVGAVRIETMAALARRQSDWHGWTWRGARRLAAAEAAVQARGLPRTVEWPRDCSGRLSFEAPGMPTVQVAAPPLTAKAR